MASNVLLKTMAIAGDLNHTSDDALDPGPKPAQCEIPA
jgi:hypothetical protein